MALASGLLAGTSFWAPLLGVALLLWCLWKIIYPFTIQKQESDERPPGRLRSFLLFIYGSFIKPHTGDDEGYKQQAALESFYKSQASVYDATRKKLLCGREDMLGIVAAQLLHRERNGSSTSTERIWVDIGGGTGYNIEAMSAYVSVPDFFSTVYLVDLSPSLCDIARKRFARLGWKNVKVLCQDARFLRLDLPQGEANSMSDGEIAGFRTTLYGSKAGRVQLVTMSYSLSMIPEFYSVIDSISSLLSPAGVIGVVDFYVQSIVDVAGRNYTGGSFNRHVNWLGRVFWRAWFEVDRVGLEAARRDYLEYRYGTILSVDERNYLLGGIPYYIWIGCLKEPHWSPAAASPEKDVQEVVSRLDAAATESPYLLPVDGVKANASMPIPTVRSKAYESAIVNMTSNLPLPAYFYQNHHWRLPYDEHHRKHTQFRNEYIYAFTWEDARTDRRLLKITEDDVILAITSAGDNVLAYALDKPKRIHAIDLNPAQNHLLELKLAAFTALDYGDVWKLFGEGKHASFHEMLISKLSEHMSSRAFQYWLDHSQVFTSRGGYGLYESGGSRHAICLAKWLFRCFGLRNDVEKLCRAKTLNEQREIWQQKIRKVLLSRTLSRAVIATDGFLWRALGVPMAQRAMIEADFAARTLGMPAAELSRQQRGQAIWEYMVNTLDPVLETTLIGEENYFYLLCIQGRYSKRCCAPYLQPKAYAKLSRPNVFDGLRIHTDELSEVISRIMPGTLTIAVIMDSMDWLLVDCPEATRQITTLNRALKMGGRVLLRSAAMHPWYIDCFTRLGFTAQPVSQRHPGSCIDRYVDWGHPTRG